MVCQRTIACACMNLTTLLLQLSCSIHSVVLHRLLRVGISQRHRVPQSFIRQRVAPGASVHLSETLPLCPTKPYIGQRSRHYICSKLSSTYFKVNEPKLPQSMPTKHPKANVCLDNSQIMYISDNTPKAHEQLSSPRESIVDFVSHDDLTNPRNWQARRKLVLVSVVLLDTLAAASIPFHLSTSEMRHNVLLAPPHDFLFVVLLSAIGYGVGCAVFPLLSELYGRRFLSILANLGLAASGSLPALFTSPCLSSIAVVLAAFCGSAAMVMGPVTIADVYSADLRSICIVCHSTIVCCGPYLGGVVDQAVRWQWSQRCASCLPGTLGLVTCVAVSLLQDESSSRAILEAQAARTRRRTCNWILHARETRACGHRADLGRIGGTCSWHESVIQPAFPFVAMCMW
jgi:hypothetical protein